jgi:saccharopine dehydrogenase-like NADP-dependent oxidoreductase
VSESDLVVSLLPAAHHAAVARAAVSHRVPMITTSDVSEEMRLLDAEAQRQGVLLLSEIGLDPGIDHMSAARLLDELRLSGATVTHFSTCCGGLPAPDANDNPWGCKFSRSPRGVLLEGRDAARFLRAGEIVDIPGPEIFTHCWPIHVDEVGALEVHPNRDSLDHAPVYRLSGIANLFRGTIRYPGWCETLRALTELGLLDAEERPWPDAATWADLATRLLPPGEGSVRARIARRLGIARVHSVLDRLEWAGLLSVEALPRSSASPLDLLCGRLQERMAYAPGERDMIVLRHDVVAERAGREPEHVESLLVAYGERGGESAMARTVALPAAIAARLVLEEKTAATGVAVPVAREFYEPVLGELAEHGIRFRDATRAWAGSR